MPQHQRGSRDRRDWAEDINNDEADIQATPWCPGCWEDSREHSYPPGTKGPWWCTGCMDQRIKELRAERKAK
jgi:hypothetical protein